MTASTLAQRLAAVADAMDAVLTHPDYALLKANGHTLREVTEDLTASTARGTHIWVLGTNGTAIAPQGLHPFYAERIRRAAATVDAPRFFAVDADHAGVTEISREAALRQMDTLRYVTDSVHRERALKGWEYGVSGKTPDYVTACISENDSGGGKGTVHRDGMTLVAFHTEAISRPNAGGMLAPAALLCYRSEPGVQLDEMDRIALFRIAFAEAAKHHLATTPVVSVALDGRELAATLGIGTPLHRELDSVREAGLRSSDVPHFLKAVDYAAFARVAGNQDICDHLMNGRIIAVRKALRSLGWKGEHYKPLSKDGATVTMRDLDSPTSYNRTNFSMGAVTHRANGWPKSVEVALVDNDMSLSAAGFAHKLDTAIATGMRSVPTLKNRIAYAIEQFDPLDPQSGELAEELEMAADAVFLASGDADAAQLAPILARALNALPIRHPDGRFDVQQALAHGFVYKYWAAQAENYQHVLLTPESAATVQDSAEVRGWFIRPNGAVADAGSQDAITIERRFIGPLKLEELRELNALASKPAAPPADRAQLPSATAFDLA